MKYHFSKKSSMKTHKIIESYVIDFSKVLNCRNEKNSQKVRKSFLNNLDYDSDLIELLAEVNIVIVNYSIAVFTICGFHEV